MATHSSILAWRIPQTEEPGELHTVQSAGSQSQTRLKRLSTQANSSLGALISGREKERRQEPGGDLLGFVNSLLFAESGAGHTHLTPLLRGGFRLLLDI